LLREEGNVKGNSDSPCCSGRSRESADTRLLANLFDNLKGSKEGGRKGITGTHIQKSRIERVAYLKHGSAGGGQVMFLSRRKRTIEEGEKIY